MSNMTGSDNFGLRLNSFERNVTTAWQEMQMEEDFCDITLACQDKQIKTHKLIISSYSPLLRNILKSSKNPHPFIYLRKVMYRDLQNLLNFMYQGEVNVPKEDLSSFLDIANDLNIRGLSEGNMEDSNSNEEDPSQYTPSNFDSAIRNRSPVTDGKAKNINYSQTSHSIIENTQADDDNFSTNDNVSNCVFVETENQRLVKQKVNVDNKQNIVATLPENQFNCGKCDKIYSSRSGLDLHKKTVHEGAQYSCYKCEYKAKQKSGLKQHVRAIHEGERHPCDQCDYKATAKSSLHRHQLRQHYN